MGPKSSELFDFLFVFLWGVSEQFGVHGFVVKNSHIPKIFKLRHNNSPKRRATTFVVKQRLGCLDFEGLSKAPK